MTQDKGPDPYNSRTNIIRAYARLQTTYNTLKSPRSEANIILADKADGGIFLNRIHGLFTNK